MRQRVSRLVLVSLSLVVSYYLAYGQRLNLLNPAEHGSYEIMPLRVLDDGTVVGLAEKIPGGYYQRVFFWHPERGMQILPRLIDAAPPGLFISDWPPQIIRSVHTFQLGQNQKVMFMCSRHPDDPVLSYFYIDADINGEYRFYGLCYDSRYVHFTTIPNSFVTHGEPWLCEYYVHSQPCSHLIADLSLARLDLDRATVGLAGCIPSGFDSAWLSIDPMVVFCPPGLDRIVWGAGYHRDYTQCPPDRSQWIPLRLSRQGSRWSGEFIPGGGAGKVVSISEDGNVAVGHRRLGGSYVPFRWIGNTVENFQPPAYPDEIHRNCYASVADRNGEVVLGYCEAYSPSRGSFRYNFLRLLDGSTYRFEDLFAGAFRWDGSQIMALNMSPNGRYLLVALSNADCFEYGVIDRNARALDFPERLTVIMRNASAPRNAPDSRHAYPFTGDVVNLAVLAEVGGRFYYDTTCAPLTGRWFRPGVQYRSGGGEERNFSHTGLRYDLPTLHPWTGARLRLSWFRSKSVVDRETNNSREITGRASFIWRQQGNARGVVLHRYYNYVLDHAYPQEGLWFRNLAVQRIGTHRYYVRLQHPRDSRWGGSAQPLPGAWQPSGNDDSVFNDINLFNQHWSQNCDEESELAVRISVRAPATWVSNDPEDRTRQFVEWLSSFVDVPYEWGGCWYGGRADNQPQRGSGTLRRPNGQVVDYPGDADYQGYGTDCSGLVYAAAQLAGYDIPYRPRCRDLLRDWRLTEEVRLNDLRAGDLLVNPSHVVIVYRIYNMECSESRCSIDMDIIHAAGEARVANGNGESEIRGEKVMIERVRIVGEDSRILDGQTHNTQTSLVGYTARRLR